MKKQNRAFATIELLIAFAILLINVTSVVLLVQSAQSMSLDSETNQEALAKAEEQIEKAKADAKLDFNLLNPTPVSNEDIYAKNLLVEQIDLFTKKVTSFVDWTVMAGRTQKIALTTLVTNPEAVQGGDTCSSVLVGDWTNPQLITYKYEQSGDYICINGEDEDGHSCEDGYELGADLLNDSSSGFPITSIQTFNEKMYVTVNNTKGNNDETFFIIDISDAPDLTPSHVLGKVDNSPPSGGDISEGLNAVAIDGGNYAYVLNAYDSAPALCSEGDNCAQLQIIDISNSTNPNIVRNFKINSIASSGNLSYGTTAIYKDDILYIGLAKADGYTDPDENYPNGAELFVIDVSDPINPNILDSLEINNGVNALLLKNNYLYVASPHTQEVKVVDVENPSSISQVGFYDSSTGAGNGKSLFSVGNKLYVGKTVPNSGSDFHIVDITNPESGVISLPEIGPGLNTVSSLNGLIIRQFLAFFITGNQFEIWNISDLENITPYATPLTLPPGSGNVNGSASDCEDNFIFVGSQKENVYIPECSDGADNDSDGKIDLADPHCSNADDDKENNGQGGGGGGQSQDKGYISIITGADEE